MKIVILALLVLMAVSQGEALRCACEGTNKICMDPVETCVGSDNVCASIILHMGPHISYFKGCMKATDCTLLVNSDQASGVCRPDNERD